METIITKLNNEIREGNQTKITRTKDLRVKKAKVSVKMIPVGIMTEIMTVMEIQRK
jgi:hypothetical protein